MDDVLELYTNSISIVSSLYEITLKLDLITYQAKGERDVKTLANIRMSPQQAMALSILLDRHLKGYGEQFKEIFVPEELKQRLAGIVTEGTSDDT